MSMVEHYRWEVQRYREQISRLQQEKSRHAQDKARYAGNIAREKQMMSSSSSASSVQSHLRSITRYEQDQARCDDRIANVERKIADAERNLARASDWLSREEVRESQRQVEEHQRMMSEMSASVLANQTMIADVEADVASIKKQMNKMTVLFLAANPAVTDRLGLDEESRLIQEMIRKSEYRDSIRFVSRWAVRPMDVLQAINEENPTIVHFSGHGAPNGDIALQNDAGGVKCVTPTAMTSAIATAADSVKLAFFNLCFSEEQARSVVSNIDVAIGMRVSIGDEAARVFAAQFYSAIGFGKDVDTAFKQGKAALLLEGIAEENTPVLYARAGISVGEMKLVHTQISG